MKVISLCLLVAASASFLLTTVNANAVASYENEWELSALEDTDGDYMDIESFGFLGACKSVMVKGFKGVNGTNCIIKELINVMTDCTSYVDNVLSCSTDVPKDIQAIIDTIDEMITIGKSIVNYRTELCAPKTTTSRGVVSGTKNTVKCFLKLIKAGFSVARHMNSIIDQAHHLPSNTATCYVSATNDVVDSCNAFVPKTKVCISNM